ncbi:MAG: metallophosphoesterase family protein [Candidatus Omnitrophota bacterium]
MRLCVLSDTHIPDRGENVPDQLLREIKASDLVIHAGDFTSLDFYQQLRKLKPLKAVLGNMDSMELRPYLKNKEFFRVLNFKIGLIHGQGQPDRITDHLRESFDEQPDIIIFGHSHQPCQEQKGPTLFFNPGSATDKIFAPYNSYGILEISPQGIQARIERIRE